MGDARLSLAAEKSLMLTLKKAVPTGKDGTAKDDIFESWLEDFVAHDDINQGLIDASDEDLKDHLEAERSLLEAFLNVAQQSQSEIHQSWAAAFANRISVVNKLISSI